MKLAQRIRAMREDHDLTQTDIAKILNTSQTVYSRYERDERTLPTENYLLGLIDEPRKLSPR